MPAPGIRNLLFRGGAKTYSQRVLATGPIAYWPLWEPSGTVITDISGNGRNGAYSGATPPTLGVSGIGDGRTAASFPGATAYGNVYSVGLRDAFNGAVGSMIVWVKPAADVWTDGSVDGWFWIATADGQNAIYVRKSATNATIEWRVLAGNVGAVRAKAGQSTVGWLCLALTWNGSTYQAYYNGVAEGAAVATGTWAGLPASNSMNVGASSTVPASVANGTLAHVALWNRALSPAEVLSFASPL